MDCLLLLYIGLTTGICILFVVTCLVVNKIFNYENDGDIDDIPERSSYKTIYESEITPSNNFLLVSPSETPFKNPFYMLLMNKKKGYLYEYGNKPALADADEKSLRFNYSVENLDRSNKAVPTDKYKAVNKKDKSTANNIPINRIARFEDDDDDSNGKTSSDTCICNTCPKSENGKCNNDVKYIYRGKTDPANDIGTSVKKNKLKTNSLDACCSAMTFKQIETIMQTDSIAIIDRKTYKNCATCMSKHYVGKTNVYSSTSTPRCLAKCSQVESEDFGTRKAFKNRCTSVIQVQRVEQWIQTEPVESRKKIESHKKYISTGAVHVNSNEKCEICQLKRIMERLDKQMENDKSMYPDPLKSSKIIAHNKVQFNVTRKKPAKITTQMIQNNPKKTVRKGSSTIVSSTVQYSTKANSLSENEMKSSTNDQNFKRSVTISRPGCVSTCPNKNVIKESTFDEKHRNMIQKLSQQAQSYLEHARKITRQMKESNPTIDHYRTVKKDMFNNLPLTTRTSRVEINSVYEKNSEIETLDGKKSQTEVTIKNLIPKIDITIDAPHKNLKSSRIKVKTKPTSNNKNEDISAKHKDATAYCQPCNKQISYSNTEDVYSKNTDGKVHYQPYTKETAGNKNEYMYSENLDANVYQPPCTSAKSSAKRVVTINSKTKILLNNNKLQINHSSSMIPGSSSTSLGAKCSCMTLGDEKQTENLANLQRKKTKLAQANNVPQTAVKYTRALQPRFNIKPSPSKNIAPWYFRETRSRTNYLKAPTHNVTRALPTRTVQMCPNTCCGKKAGLIGTCGLANSTGIDKYYTCCPQQSSAIRSSQMYPQCVQRKNIRSTCYNCNLGRASGRLCRCVKEHPKW